MIRIQIYDYMKNGACREKHIVTTLPIYPGISKCMIM